MQYVGSFISIYNLNVSDKTETHPRYGVRLRY